MPEIDKKDNDLDKCGLTDKSLVNDLAGLGEILDDDLESGSREISELFKESLNRSAEGLEN